MGFKTPDKDGITKIILDIDISTRDNFKRLCALERETMAGKLRKMIEEYVEENKDELEPIDKKKKIWIIQKH